METFDLTPKQVEVWLKKAVEEDFIIKKSKPIHYIFNPEIRLKVVSTF